MSKHHVFSVALALGFLGGASLNAQEPQQPQPTPGPAEQQRPTEQEPMRPGQTPTQEAMPTQPVDPRPSTSPAEGTAADRTPPGETPTYDTRAEQPVDPAPSTSRTEGTAADRTPPGETPTMVDHTAKRGEMVGASVVSADQAPVGRVVDVVFDSANQPEFVVIQSAGKNVAVPYSVANANKTEDKIMIDESRLRSAPDIEQGEWRSATDSNWKQDATRYWEKEG